MTGAGRGAVGIAPEGDAAACRWVAVRHAADLKFDKRKAQAEARQIEKDSVLRQLNRGDGTAAKEPTSQERFKAERTGRTETPRETLREAVRQAAPGGRLEIVAQETGEAADRTPEEAVAREVLA